MPRISSIVLPMISSVRSEALAIAALHPRVRNRASAIRPFSMRTASRKSSPHTGFVTFTVLVAPGRSPKLRGCSQCWSTTALYIIRVSQSDRRRATRRATLMDTAPSAVPTSAVPTCLAKECLSATLDRTKLVSRPVPVRGQVRFRSALLELLRRQGEALGPNSWNGTRLAKRASERFREIAVIKSRTNRFIWPAAVEGTKSRFVRFKPKDDLLKQVGTALGDWPLADGAAFRADVGCQRIVQLRLPRIRGRADLRR